MCWIFLIFLRRKRVYRWTRELLTKKKKKRREILISRGTIRYSLATFLSNRLLHHITTSRTILISLNAISRFWNWSMLLHRIVSDIHPITSRQKRAEAAMRSTGRNLINDINHWRTFVLEFIKRAGASKTIWSSGDKWVRAHRESWVKAHRGNRVKAHKTINQLRDYLRRGAHLKDYPRKGAL